MDLNRSKLIEKRVNLFFKELRKVFKDDNEIKHLQSYLREPYYLLSQWLINLDESELNNENFSYLNKTFHIFKEKMIRDNFDFSSPTEY